MGSVPPESLDLHIGRGVGHPKTFLGGPPFDFKGWATYRFRRIPTGGKVVFDPAISPYSIFHFPLSLQSFLLAVRC